MDRRDFHKLTLAAVSGLVAGSAGCGQPAGQPGGAAVPPTSATPAAPVDGTTVALSESEQLLIDEPHTCRGLNSCKGLGKVGENACAGQGACASIKHDCGGMNDCKGQGGCGETAGANACKGKGGCHVPLMDEAWTTARAGFEAAMKKSGKTFGSAPAKM